MKAIMISGRTLAQGATCESKMSPEFFKATSSLSLSEEDFGSLGLAEGKNVQVSNEFGRVVASARPDKGLPKGLVFMPMGPYANAVIGADTAGSGTPQFKGVEVEIEPTDMPVQGVREMFRGMRRAQP